MEFLTTTGKARPKRLSEATRRFAYDSLNYKYGRDTQKTKAIALDDFASEGMEDLDLYDLAIEKIAELAPVRICEGEKISGAATLGLAVKHLVPVTLKGQTPLRSISHLTVNFETVLTKGMLGVRAEVTESMKHHTEGRERRFLESCLRCLDAFDLWHRRYLDALKERGMTENFALLSRVPHHPAQSFKEGVQSVWFAFAFLRLCGNWPGIGRLDWLLGDLLKKDLASGALTPEEAREFLSHLFIKGCEWVQGGNYGSGDAQHYQNIVLAGVDRDGNEVTNDVTYLILDIIEELSISDFPITVRIHSRSPEKLLRRVSEVIACGGGTVAIYNEELIIKSLTDYGYSLSEARSFANDGCWEVQVPGKTYFIYHPFDALYILQHDVLRDYAPEVDFPDFDSLYQAFYEKLRARVKDIHDRVIAGNLDPRRPGKWARHTPCTVISLLESGCIEKGLSYREGGPVYNLDSLHIGGAPDTANSLYAIKKLVFDDKKLSFSDLMTLLREDWKDNEVLRLYAKNHYRYYGNGNEEVDGIYARILDDFALFCREQDGDSPIRFPAGVSTFGRQLEWAPRRLASPHGYRANTVLAANCSPTPGTDSQGATAVIRSYCRADLSRQVTGAALDLKLLPNTVEGEEGIAALTGLIRGFIALGGFFFQPDVADASVLREAQEHPEDHSTLSVRVSGWNARFVTLNREWQDMVIAQITGETP